MSVSEPQYKLRNILKNIFPNFYFEEEYYIGSDNLRLDFFVQSFLLLLSIRGLSMMSIIHFSLNQKKSLLSRKSEIEEKKDGANSMMLL